MVRDSILLKKIEVTKDVSFRGLVIFGHKRLCDVNCKKIVSLYLLREDKGEPCNSRICKKTHIYYQRDGKCNVIASYMV